MEPNASKNHIAKLSKLQFRHFDGQSPQLWFAQVKHESITHGLDQNKEMAKFLIMSGLLEHDQGRHLLKGACDNVPS